MRASQTSPHGRLIGEFIGADRGKVTPVALLRHYPGVLEWLRLKTALSVDLLQSWREALAEAGGAVKRLSANAFMSPFTLAITPLVHGYGPLDDFARRLRAVVRSRTQGAWPYRYGYRSDAKLDAVGQAWREASGG